jgi:indole-3-glycerol phosphate synthase
MSGTPDILSVIAASRLARVEEARRSVSEEALRARAATLPPARDVLGRLAAWSPATRAVIAEVKRRSPSKGPLAPGLDAGKLAAAYERAGAFAVSCLTEPDHFGGSLSDLDAVRAAVDLPVLYKDFVADPYMVWEARAHGADLVLLIAALLGKKTRRYLELAREAGLTALVEVHDEPELDLALDAGANLIGVNNRSLKTFRVDLAVGEKLLRSLPPGVPGVAESGIRGTDDMDRLAAAGARAFLIGETFVTAADPGAELRKLAEVRR